MEHYNSLNVLPFYEDLKYQNGKKWYAYGSVFPLISRNDAVIPFQLIVQDDIASVISFSVVDAKSGSEVYSELTKPEIINKFSSLGYSVIKLKETAFPGSYTLKSGTYYLILKLQGSSKQYTYYSEVFVACDSVDNYLKITYWNDDNIYYTGGEINYEGDFKFVCYIQATIGKPDYDFEEELTKRGGYSFLESQISSKTYKFKFIAPEFLCDGLRLVRLSDYIQISENGRNYNALTFAYEPEWQAQGDLASVEAEFTVDNIIQKIASFNRRVKESFYNALLVDVNTPLGFDDESIAQYYKSYIQGSGVSNLVNGLLIRELEELKEYKDNYYAVLDTGEGAAKKILLSNLLAGIGENIDTSNFVTTDATEQNVLGVKNFNAGITIGSSKIKAYEKDGCLFIDGNLALTGGLTMYAAGTQGVGSIYDGLPIDNDTIYWEVVDGSKVLKAKGGGGEAGSVQWDNISGKPTWIGDTKPTYNWSEIQGEKPFYTKEEIAEKYVTIDTEQEISGLKHFTPGLSVGKSKKKIYEEEGVVYIDADVAVTGGMTFYATAGRSVSTIMDAVAVDGITIKKENNVLKAVAGAGSSFDENAMWVALATSDTEKQIDKSHITTALTGFATESWVSQNYATASALASVSNKLNDFLEGSDTDEIINKWKELEAFLSGMAETDNLAEVLETKADKKYVDSTFVTLGTKQTITGEKTFSSVLNTAAIKASGAITAPSLAASDWVTIAGIKLRKLEDGALILEGNLALTGGLTMYAAGTQGVGSIYDGLPIDNDTIYWEVVDGSKVLKAKEGGGEAGSVQWGNISGKPSVFATNIANITDLHSSWDAVLKAQKPNWLTAVSIATISDLNSGWDALLKAAPSSYVTRWPSFAEVTGKPSTLSGYGITDAYTKADADGRYVNVSGDTMTGDLHIQNIIGNGDIPTGMYVSFNVSGKTAYLTNNRANGKVVLETKGIQPLIRIGSNDYSIYAANNANKSDVNWTCKGLNTYGSVVVNATKKYTISPTVNGFDIVSTGNISPHYITDFGVYQGSPGSGISILFCASNQKVGIGNTNPAYKLDVTGDARITQNLRSDRIYTTSHITGNISNTTYLSNGVFESAVGSAVVSGDAAHCHMLWADKLSNGYLTRYAIGSARDGNSQWGRMYLAVGNNENGDSLGSVLYLYGRGLIQAYSDFEIVGSQTLTFKRSTAGYDIASTGNIAPHYITEFAIYKGSPGSGSLVMFCNASRNVGIGTQPSAKLHVAGDILATGGSSFYGSDKRAKTITGLVNLSLKQICEAPTIRFRWNGWHLKDDGRNHIGGIAQYINDILPECVIGQKDNFLSMDYATVAYTFAVHTARHLINYETRTDKKIKKLENRVKYLEKQLKKLGYEEVRTLDDQ